MFSPDFPPGTAFVLLDFTAASPPAVTAEEEALLSSGAVERRRDQLRAGRAAAREALVGLGFSHPPAVLRGERGEPLWPDGVCGAITHCDHFAAAAAARRPAPDAIGIDLENIARGLKQDISAHICHPAEQVWAAAAAGLRSQRLITLFSAKESIYKALYPLCRQFFGFKDVELSQTSDNRFEGRLLRDLGAELPAGLPLMVQWQLHGDYVLTYTIFEANRR